MGQSHALPLLSLPLPFCYLLHLLHSLTFLSSRVPASCTAWIFMHTLILLYKKECNFSTWFIHLCSSIWSQECCQIKLMDDGLQLSILFLTVTYQKVQPSLKLCKLQSCVPFLNSKSCLTQRGFTLTAICAYETAVNDLALGNCFYTVWKVNSSVKFQTVWTYQASKPLFQIILSSTKLSQCSAV